MIFDLGGVVIDWDPRHLYEKLIPDPERRRFFLTEICSPAWNRVLDGPEPMTELVERRAGEYPEWAGEIRAFRQRWLEMVAGEIPGVPDLIGELRAAGVPLYAITNFAAETFPIAQERYPILRGFDDVVVSGRVGLLKPDPAIYELALARFGVDRATSLFIDDRAENVAAAVALGLPAVRFTDAAALRAHPTIAAHLNFRTGCKK